jgi:uracil-DNA glycosylase
MSISIAPKIESSWLKALHEEFEKPYFADIKQVLLQENQQGKTIYPPAPLIFNAFNLTPFDKVRVVILGQDPYHGAGQAHGLCFSVPEGIAKPPSLVNIFKEIKDDLGIQPPHHGNLEHWAKQGILLLNAFLTVRANEPASHSKIGWEHFTNAVIKKLSEEKDGLIFILWGRFAQNKESLIDDFKHHILKAAHPSPLSVYNGFYGCKHFSRTNQILENKGQPVIDWNTDTSA